MGALGSSVVNSLLITEIQHKPLLIGSTSNPVSLDESNCFITLLKSKLEPVPEWLRHKEIVASSAGNNSIFRLCCLILTDLATKKSGGENNPLFTSFSGEQAVEALHSCLDCSDEALQKYTAYDNSDGPHLIVPKLCLLVAVMTHTDIGFVETVHCIGSCAGLLCDNRFWP